MTKNKIRISEGIHLVRDQVLRHRIIDSLLDGTFDIKCLNSKKDDGKRLIKILIKNEVVFKKVI